MLPGNCPPLELGDPVFFQHAKGGELAERFNEFYLVSGIEEMLSHVLPVTISENIMGYLCAKLIINSCINSVGAITGFYLNGYISSKGKTNAVSTPVCDRIVAMVKGIESGNRRIDPANLADPAFSIFD